MPNSPERFAPCEDKCIGQYFGEIELKCEERTESFQTFNLDDMLQQPAAGAVDHVVDFAEASVVVGVGNIAETDVGRVVEEQAEMHERTAGHTAQDVEVGAFDGDDVIKARKVVGMDNARAMGVADAAFGKNGGDAGMRRITDIPRAGAG